MSRSSSREGIPYEIVLVVLKEIGSEFIIEMSSPSTATFQAITEMAYRNRINQQQSRREVLSWDNIIGWRGR